MQKSHLILFIVLFIAIFNSITLYRKFKLMTKLFCKIFFPLFKYRIAVFVVFILFSNNITAQNAGDHEIIFKFEPKSVMVGEKIGYASSFVLIILILGVGYIEIRKGLKSAKK